MSVEKEFLSPIPIGGAPIFADFLLSLQTNANAKATAFYDYLVSLSGVTQQLDSGGTPVREHKNGVFLTEPTTDTGFPTQIEPCLVYLNGKVLLFEGGETVFEDNQFITTYLKISEDFAATEIEKKTFKDGVSKDLLVTYKTKYETISTSATSSSIPIPSGDESSEHVYLKFSGAIQSPKNVLGLDQVASNTGRIEVLEQSKVKYVNIGSWDMQNESTLDVAHGLTFSAIRSVEAFVYADGSTVLYDLSSPSSTGTVKGSVVLIASEIVRLARFGGGFFDASAFSNSGTQRGYLKISYV